MADSYFKKVLCASQNPKKARELKAIFSELAGEVLTLADFPPVPEPPENGKTYYANAAFKARYYGRLFKLPTLADDTGLEIELLKGKPGLYSARFLGKNTLFAQKNQKILQLLSKAPPEKRKARFVCLVVFYLPEGKLLSARGELKGEIGFEIKGEHGFGYDPIFYLPQLKKYLAEIPPELKNQLSHRARALQKLAKKLGEFGK